MVVPWMVTGEQAAVEAAGQNPDWTIVSIRGHGYQPVIKPNGHRDVLFLAFDDEAYSRDHNDPPLAHHAQKIVHFGQRMDPEKPVLVHCAAGISRSTATVLGLAASRGMDPMKTLRHAVKTAEVRGLRPKGLGVAPWHAGIRPNGRLVALLDRTLGLDGDLLGEVHKVFHRCGGSWGRSVQQIMDDAARG